MVRQAAQGQERLCFPENLLGLETGRCGFQAHFCHLIAGVLSLLISKRERITPVRSLKRAEESIRSRVRSNSEIAPTRFSNPRAGTGPLGTEETALGPESKT